MLETKVDQLTGEIQRLRNMLSQATVDYNSLQMQLIAAMGERKSENNPDTENNNVDDKKEKMPVVPRQFMGLGIGDATYENTEHSSSDERSLDRTASNNEVEAASKGVDHVHSKELGKRTSSRLRDRSPDQELSIWNSKLPKFSSPTKNADQAATEATMRKARVSVRARSESNMVGRYDIPMKFNFYHFMFQ